MKFINEVHVRLIDLLKRELQDYSHEKIKQAIRHGYVRCNGKLVFKATMPLKKGDVVELSVPPKKPHESKIKAPYPVVFEDDHLIVMIKPAGLVTIEYNNPEGTSFYHEANRYMRQKSFNRQKLHIVHRLDKEVAGLIVMAKSGELRQRLITQWKNVVKKYYALVEGHPAKDEGTIASWLAENEAGMVFSVKRQEGAKYAVTHYKVLKRMEANTLVELMLETGRKNQLRVHLAEMGCPIVGDRRYGSKDQYIRQIRLLSYSLSFEHPFSGERVELELPLPSWFLKLNAGNEKYKKRKGLMYGS